MISVIICQVGTAKHHVDQMPQAGYIWQEIDRMATKTSELHNKLKAAEEELEASFPPLSFGPFVRLNVLQMLTTCCVSVGSRDTDTWTKRMRHWWPRTSDSVKSSAFFRSNLPMHTLSRASRGGCDCRSVPLLSSGCGQLISVLTSCLDEQELEEEILRLKGLVSPLESELEHLRRWDPSLMQAAFDVSAPCNL